MQEKPLDRTTRLLDENNAVNGPGDAPVSCCRFFVLILFCFASMGQSISWNFYAPITDQVQRIYGWSNNEITWVPNVANFTFLISAMPWAFCADKYGLRTCVLLSSFLVAANCWIRLIPVSKENHLYVVFASMLFNGTGAPVFNFLGPVLSATWFPVHERGAATSVATLSAYIGTSIGFVLGPWMVDSSASVSTMERQLYFLYWIEAIYSAFFFFLICIPLFFPKSPPTPPSFAANTMKQNDFKFSDVKKILSMKAFWAITIAYSVPLACFQGWQSVLDLPMRDIGFSDHDAGLLGCYMCLFGCFGGILFGHLSDHLQGYLKFFTVFLLTLGGASFFWFAFSVIDVLPKSKFSIYCSAIIGGFCLNSSIPLFFEMIMETVYPQPEGTANGILTTVMGALQVTFLLIPPDQVGTSWMNWASGIACVTGVFCLLTARVPYSRLQCDQDVVISKFDDSGCF